MRFVALLMLLVASNAWAADTPLVRVEVEPETVTVGESIRLRVTVLGPSWFPKPPRYPSFEITNAVVRLPADSSFPVSERIDGETWSGIVRNYEVIPLVGGSFQLDDLVMQVTYADPETIKPIVANVPVPPIAFAADVPAGAENLDPYIAGTRLEIRRELEGETGELKVGDALVVTHIAELDGLPSMFIPEYVQSADTLGVSIYREEPEYADEPVASRSEKLTIVFEAGGEFELPAIELGWWNIATATIETASLPAVSVSVIGPPVAAPVPDEEKRELHSARIAAILVLAVLAGWVLWRLLAVSRQRRSKRREEYLASEECAFGQLQRALAAGDAQESYARMLTWLGHLDGGYDATSFGAEFGDENLGRGLAELRAALYSGAQQRPDLQALASSLSKARKAYKLAERRASPNLLPGLNP